MPVESRAAMRKRFVQLVVSFLVMGACLFLSAGRLGWWNAWVFLGLSVAMIIGTGTLLMRKDPELIAERASFNKGAKRWDKFLAGTMGLFGPMAIWITAGLDTRNRWSKPVPGFGEAAGVALMVAGSVLVSWAMLSNRFFSPLVRIQKERGHKVEAGGPYRFVRHPGYVGMIVSTLATPLILSSAWALVPAAVTTLLAILRTALEDRTLRRELEGYADYARRVKWRLLPGLW